MDEKGRIEQGPIAQRPTLTGTHETGTSRNNTQKNQALQKSSRGMNKILPRRQFCQIRYKFRNKNFSVVQHRKPFHALVTGKQILHISNILLVSLMRLTKNFHHNHIIHPPVNLAQENRHDLQVVGAKLSLKD